MIKTTFIALVCLPRHRQRLRQPAQLRRVGPPLRRGHVTQDLRVGDGDGGPPPGRHQGGWLFYEDDGSGGRSRVANHDVPAPHPAVVPSELYLSLSPKPWLNLLVGKKRITWGSGFAFNPTDLINPPKDPTDPNYQRAGNWLARVEFPFEKLTVSALFAPQALSTQSGHAL